jgi:hypothetical protein
MCQIIPHKKTLKFGCVTELVILVYDVMRSPVLVSLECFLWGHMKAVVSWKKLHTRELVVSLGIC